MQHYLGVEFPPIPFIWDYDDFLQPFPIFKFQKVNMGKFNYILNKNGLDGYQNGLKLNMKGINDKNTDFYILAQYKKDSSWYEKNNNELYLSFHTWLHKNNTGQDKIDYDDKRYLYKYLTALFKINGEIEHSKNYPSIKKNIKGKEIVIPRGISINPKSLDRRKSTIHNYDGVVRFSPSDICNFIIDDENVVFISMIRFPFIQNGNKREKISTGDGKYNCVVIHIFRNREDNNPNNVNYQKLIKDFFI